MGLAHPHTIAFSPGDLFNRVDAHSSLRDYRNRQDIFVQGDRADAMFYLQHGNVKLTVTSKRGKKAVVAILQRGDFFGESCLASGSLRSTTATAIQLATIVRVKRTTLARIIHEDPAFAKVFISYLLFRIGRVEEGLADQIFSSSERRLARILLALSGFGTHSKRGPVLVQVSQETLAEMVGTTRSRVSFFMNRFRKMGLIDYNGSLHVSRALRTFLHNGK